MKEKATFCCYHVPKPDKDPLKGQNVAAFDSLLFGKFHLIGFIMKILWIKDKRLQGKDLLIFPITMGYF